MLMNSNLPDPKSQQSNHLILPPRQHLAKFPLTKRPKKKKKNYDIISYQKRIQLLQLIITQKYTIKAAANKIGIKLCTAKHILYLYKNHGKIHQRRSDRQFSDDQWQQPRQNKKDNNIQFNIQNQLKDNAELNQGLKSNQDQRLDHSTSNQKKINQIQKNQIIIPQFISQSMENRQFPFIMMLNQQQIAFLACIFNQQWNSLQWN